MPYPEDTPFSSLFHILWMRHFFPLPFLSCFLSLVGWYILQLGLSTQWTDIHWIKKILTQTGSHSELFEKKKYIFGRQFDNRPFRKTAIISSPLVNKLVIGSWVCTKLEFLPAEYVFSSIRNYSGYLPILPNLSWSL